MGNKQAKGKRSLEGVTNQLKDIIKSDQKMFFILWKYAPNLLPKNRNGNNIVTFQDLKDNYETFQTDNYTEDYCNTWLSEPSVQEAVIWLLHRTHKEKMIDLYVTYYDMAKKDTKAFKAFSELIDVFFKDKDETDEALNIIKGVDLSKYEKKETIDNE